MKKTLLIKQIGSPIRKPKDQRSTLIGLGLNKLNKETLVVDNASTRGMIKKVQHLVKILN